VVHLDPLHAAPRLLEVVHVAHRLSVSIEYVRRLIRTHQLKAIRLGRRWRIDQADLEAWIDARRRAQAAEAPDEKRGRDGPRELHQNRGA
jgi:excisionase family DNA binding protein